MNERSGVELLVVTGRTSSPAGSTYAGSTRSGGHSGSATTGVQKSAPTSNSSFWTVVRTSTTPGRAPRPPARQPIWLFSLVDVGVGVEPQVVLRGHAVVTEPGRPGVAGAGVDAGEVDHPASLDGRFGAVSFRDARGRWRAPGARRILVHGVTGSGKTTLAARLGALTGVPWTEADSLTWLPGWVLRPDAEQRRRVEELCARESWILDSAYGRWQDVALARAELVVGLDYPRWLSLGRLLRRTAARAVDRTPVCNGNVERWRQVLSRDSILLWHFRSFADKRDRLLAWEADPVMPPVLRLRSPAELESWLGTVVAEQRERSG